MSIYEIRVKGHLDQQWSDWFDGLAISYDSDETTVLHGYLADEAALYGMLAKVRDLALPLLTLIREDVSTTNRTP
jgi:hypothetical protein